MCYISFQMLLTESCAGYINTLYFDHGSGLMLALALSTESAEETLIHKLLSSGERGLSVSCCGEQMCASLQMGALGSANNSQFDDMAQCLVLA